MANHHEFPRIGDAAKKNMMPFTAQRHWLCILLMLPIATSAHNVTSPPPHAAGSVTDTQLHDDSRDFDFLLGSWKVHNRKLQQRLADSHDWLEFGANDSFHLLPGNLGSEENYRTNQWEHFVAIGLHLYDPSKHQWTLYWADNRNAPGTMQTLAIGRFSDGIGTFYAPDTFNGKPITVRILWQNVDHDHARWEQAFSTDHGRTWETNWTMQFTRQ